MKGDIPQDPKALIRESYRIEGITEPECRTIFLDWALSLPSDIDTIDAIKVLGDVYGSQAPDHPMTAILKDGEQQLKPRGRRGGWKSRDRSNTA